MFTSQYFLFCIIYSLILSLWYLSFNHLKSNKQTPTTRMAFRGGRWLSFFFWCPIMCNHVCSSHFLWWAQHQSESFKWSKDKTCLTFGTEMLPALSRMCKPGMLDILTLPLLNKQRPLHPNECHYTLVLSEETLHEGLGTHPTISTIYRCTSN